MEDTSLPCEECHEVYPDFDSLMAHKCQKMIEGEGHHHCSVCGMMFSHADTVKLHYYQSHSAEQDLECPGCHGIFHRVGGLIGHIEENRCLISKAQLDALRKEKLSMAARSEQATGEHLYFAKETYAVYLGMNRAHDAQAKSHGEAPGALPGAPSAPKNCPFPSLKDASAMWKAIDEKKKREKRAENVKTFVPESKRAPSPEAGGWKWLPHEEGWGPHDGRDQAPGPADHVDTFTPGLSTTEKRAMEAQLPPHLRNRPRVLGSGPAEEKTGWHGLEHSQEEEETGWLGSESASAEGGLWSEHSQEGYYGPEACTWDEGSKNDSFDDQPDGVCLDEGTDRAMSPDNPRHRDFNKANYFSEDTGKYHCPKAGCTWDRFSTAFKLIDHLESPVHAQRPRDFQCPRCFRHFKTATALTQHAESQSRRCGLRRTEGFPTFFNQLTAGLAEVDGLHADYTPRYAVSSEAARHFESSGRGPAVDSRESQNGSAYSESSELSSSWTKVEPEW